MFLGAEKPSIGLICRSVNFRFFCTPSMTARPPWKSRVFFNWAKHMIHWWLPKTDGLSKFQCTKCSFTSSNPPKFYLACVNAKVINTSGQCQIIETVCKSQKLGRSSLLPCHHHHHHHHPHHPDCSLSSTPVSFTSDSQQQEFEHEPEKTL